MSARWEKGAVTLLLALLLSSSILTNTPLTWSASTGGNIDLYTQKEPYGGKGPNMPSDAFAPGEEVQIFALITYNKNPVAGLLVAFEISGPNNPSENITFCRVAFTDESGIATVSFRISYLNETAFGIWTVIGTAEIYSSIYQDTIIFKVGWIVEIVSLRTINEMNIAQESFSRGSYFGVELTIRNIAMIEKVITLVVTICDSLNSVINATELRDFVVEPNETLVYAYIFLLIPQNAPTGQASVYASAYKILSSSSRIPYCPEISEQFTIYAQDYYLKVKTNPIGIVAISGEGWYERNSNVNLVAPQAVSISMGIRYNFSHWDVDGVPSDTGFNSISVFMDANHTATAHYVLQYYLTIDTEYGVASGAGWHNAGATAYASLDAEVFDHQNGTRRVFTAWSGDVSGAEYARSNPILMDRPKTAIANWKTQYYLIVRTVPLGIVTIGGEGWYDKGADVTLTAPEVSLYTFAYWDVDGFSQGSGIVIISVIMNAPTVATAYYMQALTYTLTITATAGGTTSPPVGIYTYSAGMIVPVSAIPDAGYIFSRWELDGVNVGSTINYSVYMDRNHVLKAVFSPAPAGLFDLEWFYWLLLLLLFLLLLLLLLLLLRRRRSRRSEESFYSGWSAWYYCHDLRKKPR